MEMKDKHMNELFFEEVKTDELYGDGGFIGGVAGGVFVGGAIWPGIVLT